MSKQYSRGAKVVSLDGVDVGTVEQVDDDGVHVLLADSDKTMFVPYEVIDDEASTTERVVVQGAVSEDVEPSPMNASVTQPGDHHTLPLIAEEAIAHVHEVDRGKLIIDKRVEMVPHEAKVDVGTDRVEIERVPINKEVETAPETRQEGDTLIVPVIEEVLVVTKRFRIIEEVHVRKVRDVETQTFQEELRREVVDIEERDAEGEIVDR